MDHRLHAALALSALLGWAPALAQAPGEEEPDHQPAAPTSTARPAEPSALLDWRFGAYLGLGLSSKADFLGLVALGAYPWRHSGFEVRWVGTRVLHGSFPAGGTYPGVDVADDRGDLWVDLSTYEVALVTRLGPLEPWVALGWSSGSATATVEGHDATPDGCYLIFCSYPEQTYRERRPASGPSLAAGVRLRLTRVFLGLELRQTFAGGADFRSVTASVPAPSPFLGFSIGYAILGPEPRPGW